MRLTALVAGLLVSAVIFGVNSQTANAQSEDGSDNGQKTIKIKKGDTLEKIAKQNKTTYTRLFDANKNIKDPDLIFPGDNIRIPAPDEKLPNRQITTQELAKSTVTNYGSQPSAPALKTSSASGSVWDKLAACESGGNWSINTGNGYSGGLQFTDGTWHAVGGTGSAGSASKAEQIKRGKILQQRSGWGQWPACSAKLGLR